ncbi:MAG: nuclease-related domain-containing protein [Acidimicrobiia bacterium]
MLAAGLLYTLVLHSSFVGGVVVGALGAGCVAVCFWIIDHASGAQHAKFGTYGEERTWELFHRRPMRRAGWKIVNNIPFGKWDVDHVAVGPAGVLAIESKWANPLWEIGDDEINVGGSDPLEQAWRGARTIRLLLRGAGITPDVIPVVIQWGPGGLSGCTWSYRRFSGGVLVLRGPKSADWIDQLAALTESAASPELGRSVCAALEERIADSRKSRPRVGE